MPGQGGRPGAGTLGSHRQPVGNGRLPTFTLLSLLSPGGRPGPSRFSHTEKAEDLS